MSKSLPKEPERNSKKVSKCELKQITERAKPKEEEHSDGISSGYTAQHSRETVSTWCVHSPSEFNQQTKFNEIISKSNNNSQTKQAKTKLKNKTALLTQTKGIISQSRSRVIGSENNQQKKQTHTTKQKEILAQGSSCSRIKQSFKANLTTPRSQDLSYQQYSTLIQSEKRNECRVNTQRHSDDRRKQDEMEENNGSEDISSGQGNRSSANSSSEDFGLSNSGDIDQKRNNQLKNNYITIPNETSENEEEQEEVKSAQSKLKIRSFSSNTKSELLSKMQELEGELKRETTRRRRLEKQVIQSTSDLTQLMCQLSIFQQNVKETKIFALQAAAKANNKSFSSNNFYENKELLKEYASCHQQQHNHSQSQICTPIPDRTHSFQEETPSKQSSSVSRKLKYKQQEKSSRKTKNRDSTNVVVYSHANQKRSTSNSVVNHSQVINISNNYLKDAAKAKIIDTNTNFLNSQKIKTDTSASAKQSQKNSQIEMIMSRTFQQQLEHEPIMEDAVAALSQRQIGSGSKYKQDPDNSLCLSLSKLSVTEQSSGLKSNRQVVVQPVGQEPFLDIKVSQNNTLQEPKQIQQSDDESRSSNNNNSKINQIHPHYHHQGFNFDNKSFLLNQNTPSMFQDNNFSNYQQQSHILSNNKFLGDETTLLKQEPQPILVSNSQSQSQLSREQYQQQQRQLQNQLFLLSLQQQNEPSFQQTQQQPLSKASVPQSNQESSKQQQPLFYRTACKTNIQLNSSSQDFLSLADLSCNSKNKPVKTEQTQYLQQQAQHSVNNEFGLASGASIFSLGSDTLSYSASRKTTPNKQSSSQLFLTPSKSPALFFCPSSKGLKLNNSTSSFNICSSQHAGTHSSQFQTPQKK